MTAQPTDRYAVIGIGNAIVDLLGEADDSFLALMGIEKGVMQLIERDRASPRAHGRRGRMPFRAARARALQEFREDVWVDRMGQLYRELIKPPLAERMIA